MKMQVYGKYKQDMGTFGNTNIDVSKTLDWVNGLVANNGMWLNYFAGVGNILNAAHQMNVEAFAGEFFERKDLLYADAQKTKNLPEVFMEIGKRSPKNKLLLMMEAFNTKNDYESRVRGHEFHRKSRLNRLFKNETMFMFNDGGEFIAQNRTFIALAYNYKLKDSNGKDTNV